MLDMKKLPLALTVVGLGAAASFAEIKINDNFSTSGFVDMSALGMAPDSGDASLGASLDQYEMDFMYKFGFFSARADINSGSGGANTIFTEQAYITAALTTELSLGMGRFLSTSGFEAAEPTGLYQYSVSKLLSGYLGGTYGGYQNGVNIAYATPKFGVYGAIVTDIWAGAAETELLKSPGFELQLSVMPVEGVTAKVTGLFQMYDEDANAAKDNGQDEINAWASYAKGKITAAAEFSYFLNWASANPVQKNDATGMGWLAMFNYKITDKLAATVRYSAVTLDDEISASDDMDSEITLSPSFAVSPNWLALAEVRMELDGTDAQKGVAYAVESTFSF